MAIFKCDNCDSEFERDAGLISKKRLSNNFYHVCPNCNQKKFAQNKGAERRKLWNMSVDTDIDLDKIGNL